MKPKEVKNIVGDLPYMQLSKAEYLYDFLLKNKCVNCLELGFYHGVSSIYIGGAMQDFNGKLITIDRDRAKDNNPNIENLVAKANLQEYISYYFEPYSYTWRLMRMLQEGKSNSFDFCYIDGHHTWDDTGFAFFLVSKLLKKNGWVLFDDLTWTMEKSQPQKKDKYPYDMFSSAQVGLVYDLLVKTDKRYSNFLIPPNMPSWGFAQKIED